LPVGLDEIDGFRSNMGMNPILATSEAAGGWELTPQNMWIPFAIIAVPPVILMIWFFWADKRLRERRARRSGK